MEEVPALTKTLSQMTLNYEACNLRKPQMVSDLGRDCTSLHHVFGMDVSRRGNLFLIEDERLMFASSGCVVFENVISGHKEYLMGIDEAGVGCITVHPSRKLFAVGGRGFQPKIYVYSYPELKIVKVLSGGAERSYGCLNFSADGEKLASVSIAPDFMLTIWDWEIEQMGLHSKAFGQDIYKVQFSVDDPRRLTTSGTGHIRFWKMAATFTGLKLQGFIGKFGKIDLSDIENFVELPDGKVLSGTETGSLLLWEGNFIKCRFTREGGQLCHEGNVTYLELDRAEKCVITASLDGYIRWWDLSAVDSAEVDSDHSMDFELTPVAEYRIGGSSGLGIKAMLDSGIVNGNTRFFVVLDTRGRLQTITFTLSQSSSEEVAGFSLSETVISLRRAEPQQVTNDEGEDEFLVDDGNSCVDRRTFDQFHSGPVTGLDTCPVDHLAVTCGSDGIVRCIDYVKRKEIASRQFSTAATCAKWLPPSLDSSGQLMAVGFADGVVRVLGLGENNFGKMTLVRKSVFKPHNAPVTELAFNDQGTMLATTGKDGIIFFLECVSTTTGEGDSRTTVSSDNWNPIRFVTVGGVAQVSGKAPVSCERISWSANSASILCSCSDSVLREIDVTSLQEARQHTSTTELVTFEALLPIREVPVRVPVLSGAKNGSVALLQKAKADDLAISGETANEEPTAGGEAAVSGNASPTKMTAQNTAKFDELSSLVPSKVSQAIYSRDRGEGGVLAACSLNQRSYLFECDVNEERPLKEVPVGLYSSTGVKDYLKAPQTTAMRYSWSKKFLLTGTSDGSVTVRSAAYLETFTRAVGHNGGLEGTAFAACSFDDSFALSVGQDGMLVVHKLRLDLITERSEPLFKDLDAGVFGDDILKPVPKQPVPEPAYLTFVTAATSAEGLLKSGQVLSKPLLRPDQEQNDISGEAYSIQDNRLKLEEDAQKSAAGDLKSRVLASIKVLQRDYENIVRENESIPEVARLTPEEMTVDREYFAILAAEEAEMIEEVHRECAYDCEKSEKLLKKVQDRLQHNLLVEEFALSAFKGYAPNTRLPVSIVKSLRAQALDPTVVEILKEVQAMVRAAELKEAQNRTNETAQRKALEAVDEMKSRLTNKEEAAVVAAPTDSPKGKANGSVDGTVNIGGEVLNESSAAARRLKRKERKEGMAAHLKQKPDENEDDVRDLTAIKLAEKTVGDYKLKCAEDYEVPEDQRINAFKKMRQMAMLEESMLTMRLQFDKRFFALRNLKRQIIFDVRRDNARIREIDAELNQPHLSQSLWEPQLDPAEYPDDADEVTPSELASYQEVRSWLQWDQAPPPPQSVTTGTKTIIIKNPQTGAYEARLTHREITDENRLKDFLTDEGEVHVTPPRKDPPKYYEVNDMVLGAFAPSDPTSKEAATLKELESKVPVLMAIRNATRKRLQASAPTLVQQMFNEDARRKLSFERDMILKNMRENVEAFREAVDDLRLDRHSVIADIKLAELKLLTLFQEYKLLQTFESRDNTLQQKQIKCKSEETEIVTLGSENKARLEGKLEEIQHWNEKLQQINAEFKVMLPDNHPYSETLTKIFRKKVKRSKGGGADGEDGEEEDFEESEDEEEDDDDDGEEVEDICPPGCDQPLFERILDLREKKLDTEEISAEIAKSIEDLRKTIDRLKQREKQIVKDAIQTELEVQQFQLQKQAALNQINVVVPLRASQLFMFEHSGKLTGPTDKGSAQDADNTQLQSDIELLKQADKRSLVTDIDLKSHVLFTSQNLVRLQDRIAELHSEIDEAKESLRHLHKERGVLIKERENQQSHIETWSSRCLDLQMLKFGRVIDLDELEARSDRLRGDKDDGALREDEEGFKQRAAALSKEALSLQEQLTQVTLRNTQLLNEVAELTETQLSISRELNAPGQVVSSASKLDNFKEAEETKRIVAYVQFQAKELESLRAELTMLKRKEAPPLMSQTHNMAIPSPPYNQSQTQQQQSATSLGSQQLRQTHDLVLPPIPSNKRPK